MKPKSSRGFDNMSNNLLKNIKYEIADYLTNFVNEMFKKGEFPDSLKIAKIVPIYKKGDIHKFENYRPISLLSSISKVFERVIHDQIYTYFTESHLLYTSQYGFRTQHSTEYAALELLDKIIIDMDQGNIPINIYMDLSKAFDTVDHSILLLKLKHYGIGKEALKLLTNYLSNRIQYVTFNSYSSSKMHVKSGVPQGSILGPLLFIIYVNDIVNVTKAFTPLIYADDITLYANINSTNINILNNELYSISNWLKMNKLSLNINKTKAMIFHTPQRKIDYPNIYINKTKIDFVNSFNFLGITIDEHLNWNEQIDKISKKISRTLAVMSKIKNFLPSQALLHIYNSLVSPYLNYGLLIWGWKGERLLRLQKRAVRMIMGQHYRAHTSDLFRKLNILKFPDLCALHEYKFCFKIHNLTLPHYFCNMHTILLSNTHRYSTRNAINLKLPFVRHTFATHCISYKYPKTLNSMPIHFKEKIHTHSFQGFKFYIKKIIVNSYVNECITPNCYSCQHFSK